MMSPLLALTTCLWLAGATVSAQAEILPVKAEPHAGTTAGQLDAYAYVLDQMKLAHNRATPAVISLADLMQQDALWRQHYIQGATASFANLALAMHRVDIGTCFLQSAETIDAALTRLANPAYTEILTRADAMATLRNYCLTDAQMRALLR